AKQSDTSARKIPLTIEGPANISIINKNDVGVDKFTVVIYVVEKEIASSTPYEVYDIADVTDRTVLPKSQIVSFISSRPYRMQAQSSDLANKVEIRLAGFDNALDGHKDGCDMAYQTEGDPFSGFTVEPNTPIISLAIEKSNQILIKADLNFGE
ncbi:hypothetical protein PENTCL1PPCAC_1573, partial [Pristionchus entomophagus]